MKASIPKNIKKYESKAIFMFTKRQAIFIAAAIAVFALFFILLGSLSLEIRSIISCFLAAPVAMTGFLKVSGIYLEDIFKKIINEILYKADYRPFKLEGFNHEKK